jgi:hypothetical protein
VSRPEEGQPSAFGAIPGVSLEQGSEALQQGLGRALDETGLSRVPRNWLQCVATAV